jgi:MFS family permease
MVASFASCMIGYDSAFIGTTLALPSFVSEFGFAHMDKNHLALIKANIVSVYQAGAFFGSLIAYASAYFVGRKKSLWLFVSVFLVGAGIMLAAKNGNVTPILVGRVLAGVGVGGSSMIVRGRVMGTDSSKF